MGQSLVFKVKLDSWSCNSTSAKGAGEEQYLLTSKIWSGRMCQFTAGPELSLCLLIPWPARGTGPESESICLLRVISRETEIIYLSAWLMEVCRDQCWTWNCLSAHLCLTSTKTQRDHYQIQNYLSIHSSACLLSQLWDGKQTSRNTKCRPAETWSTSQAGSACSWVVQNATNFQSCSCWSLQNLQWNC